MTAKDYLFLKPFVRLGDAAVAFLRCATAAFLIYRSLDKAVDARRMDEFEQLLAQSGVIAPQLLAPLCVTALLVCGFALVLGLLTRWAGLATSLIFLAALLVGELPDDFGIRWPNVAMVFLGLLFATAGPGRYSLDSLLLRHADQ